METSSKNKNIDFDSDVEVDSLKDAVWRLTTRVYLLEDFIAEKFGEVLGPSGYSRGSNQSAAAESNTRNEPGSPPCPSRKRRSARNIARSEPNVKSAKLQQKSSATTSKVSSSVINLQLDANNAQVDEIEEDTHIIKDEVFSDVNADSDNDDIFPLFNEGSYDDSAGQSVEYCEAPPDEDDNEDDDTVMANEDSQDKQDNLTALMPSSSIATCKKTRGKFTKPWKVHKNFDSHTEAEEYMKTQKQWSLKHRYAIETGVKHLYRCNLVKKRAPPCPSAAYIIYYSYADNATLYVTDAEHVHQNPIRHGMSETMQSIIDEMYDSGLVTPKDVRLEILKRGLSLPNPIDFNNYFEKKRSKLKRLSAKEVKNNQNVN